MMPAKGSLAVALIALTLFGCTSGQPTAALGGSPPHLRRHAHGVHPRPLAE